MKFEKGDIIKCPGRHFNTREIIGINGTQYITKFVEDGSIVESEATVIDSIYFIKVEGIEQNG